MRKLIVLIMLCALAHGATPLTGKWSGSFDITNSDGDKKADTAYMDLSEQDGTVAGTAGPNAEKQWALRNGKLNGQKLTFEVQTEDGGVLVFDLTFDGESIQGKCNGTGNGGEKMSANVSLKRTS